MTQNQTERTIGGALGRLAGMAKGVAGGYVKVARASIDATLKLAGRGRRDDVVVRPVGVEEPARVPVAEPREQPAAAAERRAAEARADEVEVRADEVEARAEAADEFELAADELEAAAQERRAEKTKATQRRRSTAVKRTAERRTAARRPAAARKPVGRKAAAAKADTRDPRAKKARLAQAEGEAEALDERTT